MMNPSPSKSAWSLALLLCALVSTSASAAATIELSAVETTGEVGGTLEVSALFALDEATSNVEVEITLLDAGHFSAEGFSSSCGLDLTLSAGADRLLSAPSDFGAAQTCTITATVMLTSPGAGSVLGTLRTGADTTSAQGRPTTAVVNVNATPLSLTISAPSLNWSIDLPSSVPSGASPTLTVTIDGSGGLPSSVPGLTDIDLVLPSELAFGLLPTLSGCSGYSVTIHTQTQVKLKPLSPTPDVCVIEGQLSEIPYGQHSVRLDYLDNYQVAASTTATIEAKEVPTFGVQHTPQPGLPGGTITQTFTITNLQRDGEALTDISFTTDLNATLSGLTAIGLPSAPCGPDSLLSGTSTLSLSGAHLESQESCEFSVTLAIPADAAAGEYTNTTSPLTALQGGVATTLPAAGGAIVIANIPVVSLSFENEVTTPGATELVSVEISGVPDQSVAEVGFRIDLTGFAPNAFLTPFAAGDKGCGDLSVTILPGSTSDQFDAVFSGGSVGAGESCTFDLELPIPDPIQNGFHTLSAGSVTFTLGGDQSGGIGSSTIIRTVSAPSVILSASEGDALIGELVTFEVTLDNQGNNALASEVAFSLDLDSVIPGAVAVGLPLADPCGAGSELSGSSVVALSAAELFESCTFTFQVQLPSDASEGVVNLSTTNTTGSVDGVATTGTAGQASLTLLSMELDHAFNGGDPITLGEADVFAPLDFSLMNLSDSASTISGFYSLTTIDSALEFVDPNPTDVSLTSACTGTITPAGNLLIFTVEVPANTSCTFGVEVAFPPSLSPDTYGSTFTLTSALAGGAASTIESNTSVTLLTEPFVFTLERLGEATVNPGGELTLRYTFESLVNQGALSGVTLTHDLASASLTPLGLPMSDVCGEGSELSGGGIVTLSGGSIEVLESCSFDLSVRVDEAVTEAVIVTTTDAPVAALDTLNVSAPEQSVVLDISGVKLTRASGPAVTPGATTTLTYTLENLVASAATGLRLSDELGALMEGVTLSLESAEACGGSLSVNGTDTLRLDNGTLEGLASCTFVVNVTFPVDAAPGDYVAQGTTLSSEGLELGTSEPTTFTVLPIPLDLSSEFSPSAAPLGGVSTYTLTMDNSQMSVAADAVEATISLPEGLMVADPSAATTDCVGGTLTAEAGASSVSYVEGGVSASASCTLSFSVVTSATGEPMASAALSSSLGTSEGSDASLTVMPLPTASVSLDPVSALAGSASVMSVTVDNSQSGLPVTGLSLASALPEGVSVADPAEAVTSCGDGTLEASPGASSVSLDGGSLDGGASCTLSVHVVGTIPGATAFSLSASAYEGLALETTGAELEVLPIALGSSSAFAPASVYAGGVSTYTVTLDNSQMLVAADAVEATISLPEGLMVADPSAATTDCVGGTLTAEAGASSVSYVEGGVSASASCTLSFSVVTSATGEPMASAALSSSLGTSEGSDASLTVMPLPTASVSLDPVSALAGSASVMSVTVDNSQSGLPVTGLSLASALPEGVSVADPAEAVTSCGDGTLEASPGASSVSLDGGSLDGGASCTLSVHVVGTIPGATAFSLSASAYEGLALETTGAELEVLPIALGSSSAFAPASVYAGGVSTYTVTLDNSQMLVAADAVEATISLPEGLMVADPSAATTDCVGGTLTAEAGASSVSYVEGGVSASASCTLSFSVVTSATGEPMASAALSSSLGTSEGSKAALTVMPLPTVSMSLEPATISASQSSTLTFTIDNAASVLDASALVAGLTLPEGLSLVEGSASLEGCGAALSLSEAPLTTLSLSEGVVLAGQVCTLSASLSAASAGSYLITSDEVTTASLSCGDASATLDVQPLPTLEMTASPDKSALGQGVTLSLVIDNSVSTLPLSGLTTGIVLPEGVTPAVDASPITTCAEGVVAYQAAGAQATLEGASLAPGETCALTLEVVSAEIGSFTAQALEVTHSQGSSGTSSTSWEVEALPWVELAFEPEIVGVGQDTLVSLTLNNSAGAFDLSDVAFALNLPEGLTLASDPQASTTCEGDAFTLEQGQSITHQGGATAKGATCQYSFALQATAVGPQALSVASFTTSRGALTPTSSSVTVEPTLGASLAFTDALIGATQSTRLTLTLDNSSGSVSADLLEATLTLGEGLAFAEPAEVESSCGAEGSLGDASTLALSAGSLEAGQSCTLSANVVALNAGAPSASASLSARYGVEQPSSVSLSVEGAPLSALEIAPNPLGAAMQTIATVTIDSSAKALDLEEVNLDLVWPEGLIAVDGSAESTCQGVNLSIEVARLRALGATLSAGETCTFSLALGATEPGLYTLSLESGTSSHGPLVGASADVSFVGPPVLSASLTPAKVGAGVASELEVVIDNSSSSVDVSGLSFAINAPDALVLSEPESTCGDAELTLSPSGLGVVGGSLMAEGSCALRAKVQGGSVGLYDITVTEASSSSGVSAGVTVALEVSAALSVSLSAQPDVVMEGDTSTLTFALQNLGAASVQDIALALELPTGLEWVEPAALSTTCEGGSLLTEGRRVSYTEGALAAQSSCTVSVEVLASTGGVDYILKTETPLSSVGQAAVASETLRVEDGPRLGISLSPDTLVEGEGGALVVTIDNGLRSLTPESMSVSVELPEGLAFGDEGDETTCEGGTLTREGSRLSYEGGTVAAGALCQVTSSLVAKGTGDWEVLARLSAQRADEQVATVRLNILAKPIDLGGPEDEGCNAAGTGSGGEQAPLSAALWLGLALSAWLLRRRGLGDTP